MIMKYFKLNLWLLSILIGINAISCRTKSINQMWKGPKDCSAEGNIIKCDSGITFIFNVTDDAIVAYNKTKVRDYKDYNDRIDLFLDGRKYNGGREDDRKTGFVNFSLVPVFEKDYDLCTVKNPNVPILKSEYRIRSEITKKGYYIECFLNYGFFNRINFSVSKGFNFLVVVSDADKNLRETRIFSGKVISPDIITDNFEYADFKGNTCSFSIDKKEQVVTPPLYLEKLNIKAGVLPEIDYTPKPDNISSLQQILDGKWKFYPEIQDNFPAVKGDSAKEVIIPGSHSLQGYLFGKKETGGWVTTFFIPESWKNKSIKLRFLSIEGLAKIYVNNQLVGSHDGQYLAFELDITKYVKYNRSNELAVSIFKDSGISISSSRNTGYIHGDITRSVELLAVPELHISKIFINTDFDKDFIDGKLKIDFQITNNESKALKPQIRFNLTGPKGEQINLFPLTEDLVVIQPQTTIHKQLDITIPKAIKWDYEHPNLYKLTAELLFENQPFEIVSQNVGFRKIEIRGNEIFLNNRSIKIKGTNYHPSHPLTGWALSKEFAIKHVKLLKEANINYVRIWPHMEEFIDECDKAGMLLQVEVPFSFLNQQKVLQDSLYIRDGIKLAMEMIDFYRNHPSVIVWSVGNESSYLPVFEHMALSVKKADNSRPVIMSQNSQRGLGIPSLDFDTDHYPAINSCSRSDISRPILYTEWCHTNSYNIPEFATDPGLRDYWANFLKPHIEYIYNNNDGSIGGCLFTSISLIYRFPQGIEGATSHPPVWGFIDEWCRPQPEYWHVKKTNSPVQITDSKSSGDKVQLSVESRFDFTDMNELNIKWNYGTRSGKISPDIKPRSKGIIEIPIKTNNTDKLHITFSSPHGYIIDEYEFNFNNEPITKPAITSKGLKTPELNETDGLIIIRTKNIIYTFSRKTGLVKSVKDNSGKIILLNSPLFFATETPHNPNNITLTGWKLGNIKYNMIDNKAVIDVTGKYNEAEGNYTFTINDNAEFKIAYEFKWTGNDRTVKETGICLDMPETFNILTWKRKGFWNYYPSDHIGRLDGAAKMYRNNTFTPIDSLIAPDWNWEQDETLNGTNDFRSTKYNIYNASLSNTEYIINVLSDGSQNIRAWYNNENKNTSMLVSYISNGGWENFLRGDANLRSDLFYLKKDVVIKDNVCFNVEKLNK